MTLGLQQASHWTINKLNWRVIFLILLGFRKYCKVDGISMEPTILEGDIIIYRPVKSQDEEIVQGSLIVINHPLKENIFLIKRVHFVNDDSLDVRGDNQKESTDSRQFGLINKNQLVGTVEIILRKRMHFKTVINS